MADATKGDVTCLYLDQDEAETLCIVLRKIGGAPDTTRRGHTESMYQALRRVGYDKSYNSMTGYEMDGSMVFNKRWKRYNDGRST